MALEIERRFLVQGEDWRKYTRKKQSLRQGYLVTKVEGWTVRIRISGTQNAWLTLKYPANGITRNEFEYLIPISDAESIWELIPYKLKKDRYELELHGGDWIVDCFEENNHPLVIAEVELPSTETIVTKPEWCRKEITNEHHWSNASLAKNPISKWPMETLRAHGLRP